jgi:hypothetical protein
MKPGKLFISFSILAGYRNRRAKNRCLAAWLLLERDLRTKSTVAARA